MQARHYLRRPRIKQRSSVVDYTPKQLAGFYGFPASFDGSGRKIGVIELGGGFVWAPIAAFLASIGLPSVKEPIVRSVRGAKNEPDGADGAQGEVELDVCVIGGCAPGAQQLVYFAPNDGTGIADGINAAVDDDVDAISISWGAPEDDWAPQDIEATEVALKRARSKGIAVFVAAGDNGSGDGEPGQHTDYPSSSIYSVGCGGTSVKSMSPINETVWNDGSSGGATGGGVSALFPMPAFQQGLGLPSKTHRCVPDAAGNADPETGWLVSVAGQRMPIGGTSAVAPMWAARWALVCQALGKRPGPMPDLLYAIPAWARDILVGSNGLYSARSGPDCCTGIGVPTAKLEAALGAAMAPPAPAPTPPPPAPTPAPVHHTVVLTIDGKTVSSTSL